MLRYIIDGYNVAHCVAEVINSHQVCAALISYIKRNRLTGSCNNKVVVVFDGAPKDGLRGEPNFQIVFSLDRIADEVIKDKVSLSAGDKQVVVVSNDREIKDFARGCKVTVLTSDAFVAKVYSKTLSINNRSQENSKEINPRLQDEITAEMRKIWL